MTITFCGHSSFCEEKNYKNALIEYLIKITANEKNVDILLGGYGQFDAFALSCSKQLKAYHKNCKLIFVTPYITESYLKNSIAILKDEYDEILYPELEKVPMRFAISKRNRWMIKQADIVIAYITHDWGGAYQSYSYAKKLGKTVFNLNNSFSDT